MRLREEQRAIRISIVMAIDKEQMTYRYDSTGAGSRRMHIHIRMHPASLDA